MKNSNNESLCAKCKKNMYHKNGSIIGMSISLHAKTDKKFAQKQMGGYRINRYYNFCFQCLIDALMGKK